MYIYHVWAGKKHHERPWLAEFKNDDSMTSLRCLRTVWDQVSDFPSSPFKYEAIRISPICQ
jgi:hypothetical protein